MFSVRTATCTCADPVSVSCVRYFSTVAVFWNAICSACSPRVDDALGFNDISRKPLKLAGLSGPVKVAVPPISHPGAAFGKSVNPGWEDEEERRKTRKNSEVGPTPFRWTHGLCCGRRFPQHF